MSDVRKALRADAVAVMAAHSRFLSWSNFPAWAQSVSATDLPGWAIATPSEAGDQSNLSSQMRTVQLAIIVKRVGGDDLEDLMDDDAAAIIAALPPALRSSQRSCIFERDEMRIDGAGAERVGTLSVIFRSRYSAD